MLSYVKTPVVVVAALTVILNMIMTVAPATAQEIGLGYTCSGTTIVNSKSKTIKLGVAKAAVQKKIDALGSSKKDKAKKAALKLIKANFVACTKGTFSGGGEGGGETPTDITGVYTGTLVRQGGESSDRACEVEATIAATYELKIAGPRTVLTANSTNLFRFDTQADAQAGGFRASETRAGPLGARDTVTLTVTNLTDTSATFTVVKSSERRRFSICSTTLNGTFTRVKSQ